MRDLDRDVTDLLASNPDFNPTADPGTAYTLLVHHLCMRRNKRCLLVYHRTRLQKIEEMCWNGTIEEKHEEARDDGMMMEGVEGAGEQEEEGDKFSPEEEEYARQYSDLLAAAKGVWTDVDLTGSLEPPRDLFVDVRVLKDAGEIQTEYGWVIPPLPPPRHYLARQPG